MNGLRVEPKLTAVPSSHLPKVSVQSAAPADSEQEIDFLRWLVEEAYRWRSQECNAGEAA
jgi:hypothetical protein